MRNSLHAHILYLENTIQNLQSRRAQPGLTPEEIEDIELQLALAESAVEHYRQAFELELTVSGTEPPSGAGSGNGTEAPGNAKSDKKYGGRSAIGKAQRRREVRRARRCQAIELHLTERQGTHRRLSSRGRSLA